MPNLKMTVKTDIVISTDDAGRAMDAMRTRADAYERTAEHLKDGDADSASFEIEDVSDEEEARSIAKSYRGVIKRIEALLGTSN